MAYVLYYRRWDGDETQEECVIDGTACFRIGTGTFDGIVIEETPSNDWVTLLSKKIQQKLK